ncbi:MAG: hypothetical protein JSV33_03245 [bacterium]|nr:MAG: hypothetical protein JSV33_03245 [bacterium]
MPIEAHDRSSPLDKKLERIERSLTISGEFVHNVGTLQMNVTNWGFMGSLPKSRYPMSESPSAQWPSGSGIEYLYAAGLWVGALKNGLPLVSTGYPETEFYPPKDELHTIYRSCEGDLRGNHYPENPDDDFDGRIDEDWLNGMDDDGDGLIDEDFAAVGTQMFSCWYTDDQDMARIIWPEHTPMHIHVRQETYQWADKGFNDFVAARYFVSNKGMDFLSGAYIGIYADVDAGPLDFGTYHRDDQVGYYEGVVCAPYGKDEIPINVRVAYVYDDDGDDGRTSGYFGIALINYPIYTAFNEYGVIRLPDRLYIGVSSFRAFRGLQPYESGGEPTNDFERYNVLSSRRRDSNTNTANDYKLLISMGPFSLIPFDNPIVLDMAYVCGEGLEGMIQSAANATVNFLGCWVNKDGDLETGINGRETPCIGPLDDWMPDPCNAPGERIDVGAKEICWSNLDCSRERWRYTYPECYHPRDSHPRRFMTGINGKEHHVHWVAGTAPPPPNMRCVPGDHMITVLWDNFSETVPDPLSQQHDFEGYQIWRAEDWHRPIGTSLLTGPQHELWRLLETRDLINGVKPDVDFKKPYSQGGWIYEPLPNLENREQLIKMFEESVWYTPADTVPCPPGLENKQCDTLEAIARYRLGFEGGRIYYRYVDTEVKNGLPYFFSVTAYDHRLEKGEPTATGKYSSPASNFTYVEPVSAAQEAEEFNEREIYVVPNPVTSENMEPWKLEPNNADPSGLKCEFRNLPACQSTVRIFTVSGDLVQTLYHDGRDGNGSLSWNLITRNGQDVTSGVYLYSVQPDDGRFERTIGKFVVIR